MHAETSRRKTSRPWLGALLAALLLLATALPATAGPADVNISSLWQDVVAWVVGLVNGPPAEAGPPAGVGPERTGTQSLQDCGTPQECEAGIDIEPHG